MTTDTIQTPKSSLEYVSCPGCGKSQGRELFRIREFPVLLCPCGIQYVSPRLVRSELMEMYSQKEYYQSENSLLCGYQDYLSDKDNIIATFKKRLDWMLRAAKIDNPGRVLDIGCAAGFSIEYCLSRGWDAYGLEPSAFAASAARSRLGDRVLQGTLDDHVFPDGHFDTVLLWDVIEHLTDPFGALEKANRLLKPGGILNVITPDCGSFLARWMGRRWMEYAKPAEHIVFFSRQTLGEAFKRTGFREIGHGTAGKYVEIKFLLERFCATFSIGGKMRDKLLSIQTGPRIYVDPRDKMMVLAVKE